MGKAKIRFGLELRPIHQKNKTNTKRKSAAAAAALKKLRQPSKAARMSRPAFRHIHAQVQPVPIKRRVCRWRRSERHEGQ